jgi:hypothetical protein
MFETFANHKFFSCKIVEQTSILNFNSIIENNLLLCLEKISDSSSKNENPEDQEDQNKSYNSEKIFTIAARQEKKFCTIMGIYGVKETTLSIINFSSNNSINTIKCPTLVNYLKEHILLSLELVFILLSDEYNMTFFREPMHIQLIIDFLKTNIKEKNITCLLLKIINLLTLNYGGNKKTPINFNSNSNSNQRKSLQDDNISVSSSITNNKTVQTGITYLKMARFISREQGFIFIFYFSSNTECLISLVPQK